MAPDTAEALQDDRYVNRRYLLCGYARNAFEDGKQPSEIRFGEDDTHSPDGHELENLLEEHSRFADPLRKLDQLLLHVARHHRKTAFSDGAVVGASLDYPITYARNMAEYQTLRVWAKERGLIERDKERLFLTPEGWERIRELEKEVPQSDQAFVAMWFDGSMKAAFENGIRPALMECGYEEPFRVDQKKHINKIDDEIIAMIRRSSLLIADFTGQRGGVYFEAGFAKGLGIPVIWTCEKTDLKKTHFDTRQYNHIVWETGKLEQFKKDLVVSIRANVPGRASNGPARET
jgi:hypothetical protein